MTTRDHCPTCGHRHQRGPTGRLVCGGDDGTCKCDPADPCRCGVCEMARASRGERKPSARWVELYGNYYLAAGDVSARANPSGWWCVYRGRWTPAEWQRTSHRVIREGKTAPGIGAAMSGAEDALLAIAAEIVGAVGRSAAVNARRLVEEYGNACAAAPAAISACVDGGCDAVDSMTSTIDRGNAARDELLRALGVETP